MGLRSFFVHSWHVHAASKDWMDLVRWGVVCRVETANAFNDRYIGYGNLTDGSKVALP